MPLTPQNEVEKRKIVKESGKEKGGSHVVIL